MSAKISVSRLNPGALKSPLCRLSCQLWSYWVRLFRDEDWDQSLTWILNHREWLVCPFQLELCLRWIIDLVFLCYIQSSTKPGFPVCNKYFLVKSIKVWVSLTKPRISFLCCAVLNPFCAASQRMPVTHMKSSVWHLCWTGLDLPQKYYDELKQFKLERHWNYLNKQKKD